MKKVSVDSSTLDLRLDKTLGDGLMGQCLTRNPSHALPILYQLSCCLAKDVSLVISIAWLW